MKVSSLAISTVAALVLCACSQAGEAGAGTGDEAETSTVAQDEIESPDETTPAIGASDNLLALSCAAFLETAAIASDEAQDEASLAAQDEIANGLIWLHGYLHASSKGEIEVLSQDWMKTNVKRVFDSCSAAEDPAKVNLFEVAKS